MTNHAQPLREEDVDPDPVRQFRAWFQAATDVGVPMPEAAAVATADGDGTPSVRMVLVKEADDDGFVFYTNYESRKARELAANPRAALLFYWDLLGRQVRIEGGVQRTAAEESAAYIRTRARGSQLSALSSPQSRPVENRAVLETRVAELADRYAGARAAAPRGVGRVPAHPGDVRVLAEPPGSPPRPAALPPPPGGRLGDRASRSVARTRIRGCFALGSGRPPSPPPWWPPPS